MRRRRLRRVIFVRVLGFVHFFVIFLSCRCGRKVVMTKNHRQELGHWGEEMAEQYLKAQGYEVLMARFRIREGEVDLVCVDQGARGERDVLVFVEVRARESSAFGSAIESIDTRKVLRLSRVAQAYLRQYNWRGPWRIDVIGFDQNRIQHLKDVTL